MVYCETFTITASNKLSMTGVTCVKYPYLKIAFVSCEIKSVDSAYKAADNNEVLISGLPKFNDFSGSTKCVTYLQVWSNGLDSAHIGLMPTRVQITNNGTLETYYSSQQGSEYFTLSFPRSLCEMYPYKD